MNELEMARNATPLSKGNKSVCLPQTKIIKRTQICKRNTHEVSPSPKEKQKFLKRKLSAQDDSEKEAP
jgi:hypothetical protein